MTLDLSIRLMAEADIVAVDRLRAAAGWNQTQTDWLRVLRYQPEGCFVAEVDDTVVGTITTTSYGTELAWIGMMLVHADFQRRGIATLLMNRALDYLNDTGVECIKLDATPAGEPVYQRLGFLAEWQFHRWQGTGFSAEENQITPTGTACDFYDGDLRAFGVCRRRWLHELSSDSFAVAEDHGFGMLRQGQLATYLGPVSADEASVADRIITSLLQRVQGNVFWDIPSPNEHALIAATAFGFRPVRELTRMWTGKKLLESDLRRQFALSDPGMG